ncbi:MAG: LysR family transcriptional regulator [Gammaproteobacteria bacterium]
MDINLLRTFLEVARLKHFGKAADSLFLTQSAVSARIKQLETALRQELFIRKHNDLQLTSAGQRLAVSADSIVREWERTKGELALVSDAQSAVLLRIGYAPDCWELGLRHWWLNDGARDAEHSYQLQLQSPAQLGPSLLSGSIDLALLFDPLLQSGLESMKVADVDLILVASKAATLESLGSMRYLSVEWGTAFAEFARQEVGPPPTVASFTVANNALDDLLNLGGACYLPETMANAPLKQGLLHEVRNAPRFPRAMYLNFRRSHPRLESIQSLAPRLSQSFSNP